MKKIVLLPFLIALFLFSCKKEIQEQCQDSEIQIAPDSLIYNEYYPCYPGSYWNYDNSNYSQQIPTTFENVKVLGVKIDSEDCKVHNNYFQQVWSKDPNFYQLGNRVYLKNVETKFNAIRYATLDFSDVVGTSVDHGSTPYVSGNGFWSFYSITEESIDTMTILGQNYYDILKVKYISSICTDLGYYDYFKYVYYAKNVGPIKIDASNDFYPNPQILLLSDHHINN